MPEKYTSEETKTLKTPEISALSAFFKKKKEKRGVK